MRSGALSAASPTPGPAAAAPGGRSSRFSAAVPLLTLAVAVGYVAVDLSGLDEPVPGPVPALAHAGLVVLQALALTRRHARPLAVLAVVVALDLVVLLTSGGELGIGAYAVIAAAWNAARHGPGVGEPGDGAAEGRGDRRAVLAVLVLAAVATAVGGAGAMLAAGSPVPDVLLVSSLRVALLYVLPAVVGEQRRSRERLARVLRERAGLVEQERRDRAERELQAGRTALARELHDIAGHHLSGIIVSAQAASALTDKDPDRAREMLRVLQDDARTALADLRRTVGLLRSEPEERADGSPGRVPSLEAVDSLVDDARARGQQVELVRRGEARPLSPLAETAAYRLVQESLANSARHAPGAACLVQVEHLPDVVRVTAGNGPSPVRGPATHEQEGYGLAGMAERAALVGARLRTGPQPDGGWCNELVVPVGGSSATTDRTGPP